MCTATCSYVPACSSNVISGVAVLDASIQQPATLITWKETPYTAHRRVLLPASSVRTVLRNIIHQPNTLLLAFPAIVPLAVGLLDMDGSLTGVPQTYLTSQAPSLARQDAQYLNSQFKVRIQGAAESCVLDEVRSTVQLC
jgi:hypothetical protein